MNDSLEKATALLERVLKDPAFWELSTENFASPDILVSPAKRLRDKAKLIEDRDSLITDIRGFFVGTP